MFTLTLTLGQLHALARTIDDAMNRATENADYLSLDEIIALGAIESQLNEASEFKTVACNEERVLDAWVNEGGSVDPVEAYYAGGNDCDAIIEYQPMMEYIPAYDYD